MSSTTKKRTTRTAKTPTSDRPRGRRRGRHSNTPRASAAHPGRDRLVRCPEEARDPSELVAVAKLGKAWGIHGGITVRLHNPDSECEWLDEIVWLRGDGFPVTPVEVNRWEDKSGKLLVFLAGIGAPQLAAGLTHMELLVPAEWLPETDEDEHYVHDLIGMTVVDQTRGELGTIAHVFTTGANDVWVVHGAGPEELIPAVKDFVLGIDYDERTVRVDWQLE